MQKKNGNENTSGGLPAYKSQVPAQGPGNNGSKPDHEPHSPTAQAVKVQSALRRHERAVRVHPEEAANWFAYGKMLLDIGRGGEAEEALREAFRKAPHSANYRYYLGEALGDNGKYKEAASHFRFLADVDPKLQDPMSTIGLSALTNLAYCLGEMGDWEEAFATLQPALGTAIGILGHLARFLSWSGEYKSACYLFSVALALESENPDLLHGMGYSCMKLEQLDEARDYLAKARRANPDDPDIWYDLGLTLAKMRKPKQARPCFRKVLRLDAKYFWAWYDLACLDALENRPAAAFRNLYKSIECGFKNADYLRRDPDFKSIRKDRRWRVVLESIANSARAEGTPGALIPV